MTMLKARRSRPPNCAPVPTFYGPKVCPKRGTFFNGDFYHQAGEMIKPLIIDQVKSASSLALQRQNFSGGKPQISMMEAVCNCHRS